MNETIVKAKQTKTSIVIDAETWDLFKIDCIKRKVPMQTRLEQLIQDSLEAR